MYPFCLACLKLPCIAGQIECTRIRLWHEAMHEAMTGHAELSHGGIGRSAMSRSCSESDGMLPGGGSLNPVSLPG